MPIDLRLKEAIRAANRRVRAHAASENGCRGMGSTVVAAAWDGDRLIVANAGDSRALLLRAGKLSQLSYDQTVGHEMEERLGWTREQSKSSGFSHVLTMAVGVSDDIQIRIHEEPWTPGEQLLRLIPGLLVRRIERGCSGMAGLYGMKRENYRSSLRMGWGLISALRDPGIQAGATECSSCKIQMEQGVTKPTIHPVKMLALSYGLMPELASLLSTRSEELIVT